MTVLPYQLVKQRCVDDELISPWSEKTIVNGMSFGLSTCGYDVRIAEAVSIPHGRFALGYTLEHFNMPYDLVGSVRDKSSWGRVGVAVQNTVIEPGWRGYLTVEISNHGAQRIEIPAGAPIAQILFEVLEEPTEMPYTGKYQDQIAAAVPFIHEKS